MWKKKVDLTPAFQIPPKWEGVWGDEYPFYIIVDEWKLFEYFGRS